MRVLIISDFLDSIEYKCAHWESDRFPSLDVYDVVLIDMTFDKDKRYINRDLNLYELKKEIERDNFLDINNMVLIVICGSEIATISLDVLDDISDYPDGEHRTISFDNYDFLYQSIPDAPNNVVFREGDYFYPVAPQPVAFYLDRFKGLRTYIKYIHRTSQKSPLNVTALAKMKETSDTYAAFEFCQGKGSVVVLTPYDISDSEKTCRLLENICRSYYKRKTGLRDLAKIDPSIPVPVRENMIEALCCYNHDLFKAATIMCRRTLEASARDKGIERKNLEQIIEELFQNRIINSRMKEVAHEIRAFGNLGAHGEIEITEDMANEVIKFMEYYLEYVYVLENRLNQIKKSRE